MTFKQLLFSDEKAHRISRHLLFWIIFCTDFLIQVIIPFRLSDLIHWNIYNAALINLCCYFPVRVFSSTCIFRLCQYLLSAAPVLL